MGCFHRRVTFVLFGSFIIGTIAVASAAANVEAWVRNFSNHGAADAVATCIAIDNASNIIVAGSAGSAASDTDIIVAKYSPDGSALWTNRYNGFGNSSDYAVTVAAETNGNIVVAGYFIGKINGYVVITFSAAGTPLWTNLYSGPDGRAVLQAAAVDASGNIYVTGFSTRTNSYTSSYVTIAYASTGLPLWTNIYAAPGGYFAYAKAIAVASNGNVFVTGSSDVNGSHSDYATIAYSSNGVPLWTNSYDGDFGFVDDAQAIAVSPQGNVYVTGASSDRTNQTCVTVAYSSAGVPLWTNRLFSAGSGARLATGSNVIYVSGLSADGGAAIAAFSDNGLLLWTNVNHSFWEEVAPGFVVPSYDYIRSIAVDNSNRVFVTGSAKFGSTRNCFTSAYSIAGALLWWNWTNRDDRLGNGMLTNHSEYSQIRQWRWIMPATFMLLAIPPTMRACSGLQFSPFQPVADPFGRIGWIYQRDSHRRKPEEWL